MPPPRLFEGFRAPFEKWMPDRLLKAKIFKRVLDIVRIKICHLKGENKWESSGSLDSNELGIEGHKAGQRKELIVPGQNIAFSLKKRLIRMSATDK